MQELDVMLGRWLDSDWARASGPDRASFEKLLGSEDDLLWDWLTGRGEPPAEFTPIIERIRTRTFGPDGG
jgi:succinate dehydrogenase flavin-adding protein (antitoxin of CptAB toxin-antitoxin module)